MKPLFFISKLPLFLILFPFFMFLFKISSLRLPSSSEWLFVLFSTFAQAGISSALSILLGIIGALGLLAFTTYGRQKSRPLSLSKIDLSLKANKQPPATKRGSSIELFCLLPALLPTLVTVLAYINVSEWFFRFPFSFYTVVTTHVLMNIGLSSVFFFHLLKHQTGLLPAYAFLHGANRWFFLKHLLFFEFRKDIIILFLLVFSFCWTSFSVPLLVGGNSGKTIEVFIAEKLKDLNLWPEALGLFAVETTFIFIFFLLLYGKEKPNTEEFQAKDQAFYLLPSWPCFIFAILPTCLIFLGLVGGIPFFSLKTVWADIWLIRAELISAGIQSLFLGLGVGLITFALLSMVAFFLKDLFLRRFLMAWTGASTAFMGFAFLILGGDHPLEVWLKWTLGLSLLFLPALYRLRGEPLIMRLRTQEQVAHLMGAKPWTIFRKIIHPQCQSAFWFLSGVASFWAVGDFAYSGITAGDQNHLALLIQDLMASYRLELATLITWFLMLIGAFCFFIFTLLSLKRQSHCSG